MNSKWLKKEFTQDYEDFFNSFDLVISAPVLSRYPWSGLFKSSESYFLAEKYPLRNYIGINKLWTSNSIDNGPFITLKRNSQETFIKEPLSKNYPLSRSLFRTMGFEENIGYFSEYHWADVPSMVSISVVADMLIKNKLQAEEISKIHIENEEYSEILRRIINHDQKLLNHSDFIGSSILWSPTHYINFDGTHFMQAESSSHYPDSGLSSFVLNSNFFTKPFFQSDSLFRHEEEIYEIAEKNKLKLPKNWFFESIESIGNYLTLEIFGKLKNCYWSHGYENFFESSRLFSKFRHGVFKDVLDRQMDADKIWKIIKKYNPHDASWCAVQAGRRIQVFWSADLDIKEPVLQELSQVFNTLFTLDYSSHIDWWEWNGVKIEQWISKGIMSEFVSPYEIISISKKKISTPAKNKGDIDFYKNSRGVFIDFEHGQIYINWQTVTSTELKSQSMTWEIFNILADSNNDTIYSSSLPIWGYSKNRAEMSSKIISPLKKLMYNHFNTNCFIQISWKDDDFKITFDFCDIPIFLYRKRNR